MQSDPRSKKSDPPGLVPGPTDTPWEDNGHPHDDGGRPDRHRDDRASAPAHGGGGEHAIPADLPEVSRRAVVAMAVVTVVLFAGLFLLGWIPHRNKQAAAASESREMADQKPVVTVAKPKRSDAGTTLELPGDVQAVQATALYARTNGYVASLKADIGDEVKAGQLLAEIAAPEVDAELEQARASLDQAKVVVGRATNEFNFNKSTFERYQGLAASGGVTQQQLDERRSAFNIATSSLKAAQATVAAAEAAVKRGTELQGFQNIVAPFDGTVTARGYDLGALVSASGGGGGGGPGGGRELFRVERTDTLRAFVSVPQSYASAVRRGQEADLAVRDQAGKVFKGKVERTAGALDPATRTLRVEVHFPNADGRLFAGTYGQVRFKLKPEFPPLTVPAAALMLGPGPVRVAVLDGGNKVKLREVTVGRDFGTEAEVSAGLSGDEWVVSNPGDRLADGVEVTVAEDKKPAGGGAAGAGTGKPGA